MGAKEKILQLLQANVGKIVPSQDISKATGIRSWARQLRFLRQEGYPIEYIPKLNGYILTSSQKKKGRKRAPINQKQRFSILKRNGFKCRACGRGADDGVKLQIDHKVPVDLGSKSEYDNSELQTYCEECNLGKKNFYSDLDNDEIKKIVSLKAGTERIEALFKHRKGRPISWEVLEALSGIRDWERTLRYLRQKKNMNIKWNREAKTYTYLASSNK